MRERDQIQDLVVLFDSGCTAVTQELALGDFDSLRHGARTLPARAGETVWAAYVTVGPGLKVTGLAFFLLPIDTEGGVPDSFNLPLQYLVEYAGIRHDLGIGPVRTASRNQCPVPWLAVKLWEPEPADHGPARLVQRTVLLNRLGLRSAPGPLPWHEPAGAPDDESERATLEAAAAPATDIEPRVAAAPAWAAALRQEMAAMERGYLDQIRRFRTEVLELKASLRAEREHNRRLQAMLRGTV